MSLTYETHRGSASNIGKGDLTLTRTYRHYTGNPADRPRWNVPEIGIIRYQVHPDNPACRAVDVHCTPVDGQLGWFDLEYTYDNKPLDSGTTEGEGAPGKNDPTEQPDPTIRTPTAEFGSVGKVVSFSRDHNPDDGPQAVVNSAGQPYEGMEVESFNGTITVSFNLPVVDICAYQQQFQNRINDDDYTILPAYTPYPAYTLRCNEWWGKIQEEEEYGWYTQCRVTFEFQQDGWIKHEVDSGYYERYMDSGGDFYYKKIQNPKDGQAIDAPVKLDGNGKRLVPGSTPSVIDPYYVLNAGTPEVTVVRKFYTHKPVSFTNIMSLLP